MTHYDVFNGDADGICALHQLRLAQPKESQLITGIKRDIKLLDKVQPQAGDSLTVLDISMAKNSSALQQHLASGATVFYVDHHQAGEIPQHANLTALINTDANTCTSLLVDGYLKGAHRAWAVTAAFGDNLYQSAQQAAKPLSFSDKELQNLKTLGTCINYNGYGSCVADLHFAPDDLYRAISNYVSPLDFIADAQSAYAPLQAGYCADLANAEQLKPEYDNGAVALFLLPDAAWARRISGVFANDLANQFPQRAHAVVTLNPAGAYVISVRAPLADKQGADELCSSFPSG
ncbi:MAG: DHH family phosphoesterase, partial [Gammaproteobacteria bacterium]|nr:DHH family phosphoesterase [Gammaproteobacteria bacterium]